MDTANELTLLLQSDNALLNQQVRLLKGQVQFLAGKLEAKQKVINVMLPGFEESEGEPETMREWVALAESRTCGLGGNAYGDDDGNS